MFDDKSVRDFQTVFHHGFLHWSKLSGLLLLVCSIIIIVLLFQIIVIGGQLPRQNFSDSETLAIAGDVI